MKKKRGGGSNSGFVFMFESHPTFLSLQLWDAADGGRLNDLHNYLIPAERQNDMHLSSVVIVIV